MIFIQITITLVAILGILSWSAKAQAQSRDDVRKALQKIETTAAPAPKMGAMCYKMALPAEYIEYICPLDGEKTVYSRDSAEYQQVISLPLTKNLIKTLRAKAKNTTFSLDESRLCAKCFPGLQDNERKINLVIKYVDGRTVRTEGIVPDDIRYLIGFFDNKLTYQTGNEGTMPLQKVDERLKELLGEKGTDK